MPSSTHGNVQNKMQKPPALCNMNTSRWMAGCSNTSFVGDSTGPTVLSGLELCTSLNSFGTEEAGRTLRSRFALNCYSSALTTSGLCTGKLTKLELKILGLPRQNAAPQPATKLASRADALRHANRAWREKEHLRARPKHHALCIGATNQRSRADRDIAGCARDACALGSK